MDTVHTPVMLSLVLNFLQIKKDHWYIDCNIGGGGHTEQILQTGGKVLGIDLDPLAINNLSQKYQQQIGLGNIILVQASFVNLKEIVSKLNIEPIYGVLFDLGLSSDQLANPRSGFSFNLEAPLDMRMDPNLKVTAADLINGLYENELAQLFLKYGEEFYAKAIAKKIVTTRQQKKVQTTKDLVEIILSVKSRAPNDKIHPATKVFQALRIAVNDELNNLQRVLPQALDILAPQGRLVVLSFHSLEDRIVKNFFKEQEVLEKVKILTEKPITPTDEEISRNPRSRSGKLRAAEKLR